MTRKQAYFVKQKLIGLLLVVATVGFSLIFNEAAIVCLLSVPIGLILIFTKELVIVDSYYFENEDRRRAR